MHPGLQIGFLLDQRAHLLRGEMPLSKEPDLRLLAAVLAEAEAIYAIIGGVALQAYQLEPRTTLAIDIAVLSRDSIPRALLLANGFHHTGDHPYTENWRAPGGTPIQFSDDPPFFAEVARAREIPFDGGVLRILRAEDLLHAKLRAAAEPSRRRSKQLQDFADVVSLIEEDPTLEAALSDEERRFVNRMR